MYTIYLIKYARPTSYDDESYEEELIAESNVSLEELYDLFDYYYSADNGQFYFFDLKDHQDFLYHILFNEEACEEITRYIEVNDSNAELINAEPGLPLPSFYYALLNEPFIVNEEEAHDWYNNIIINQRNLEQKTEAE